MSYSLPDNIGYIIQIMGTARNIKIYYFKKERKGKEKYVAQQRVYLTKKEGIFFKSFANQTDAFIVLNFGA